jgi:hypothetical protein
MPSYPNLSELDRLWPEEGYILVVEDEMKPPDSEDFVVAQEHHDSAEFSFPPQRSSYSYWVHDADENRYYRDEWPLHRTEQRLVEAVQTVLTEEPVDETLRELKQKGQRRWERDDVIWFEIILSHATLRGSYGSQIATDDDGTVDEQKYGTVAFQTLQQIDPDHRNEYLEARLYGNVAMHPTKAEAIERNFELIRDEYGTPLDAKEAFERRETTEEKMAFLKQFHWIGEKYARNIPMDLYLEPFRDRIAVDSRIKGILEAIDYPLEDREYEDHETFLQSTAADLGLEPWELDRTLYNFEDAVHEAVSDQRKQFTP